jgi:hypothetical protein
LKQRIVANVESTLKLGLGIMLASMRPALSIFCVLYHLINIVIVSSQIPDRVQINGEFSFARYATIESRQARIDWDPQLSFMPRNTVDFLEASSAGAWAARLDGPGDEQEQVLLVRLQT